MAPSLMLIGLVPLLTVTVALGQLEKPGYCRVAADALRALPGNFSRVIDQDFRTTQVAGAPIPAVAAVTNCTILSFSSAFDDLIGQDWALTELGPSKDRNWVHEGATLLNGTNEVFVISKPNNTVGAKATADTSRAEAWRISLVSGEATPVQFAEGLGSLNGATNYGDELAVSVIGSVTAGLPAGVARLDPYSGNWSWISNNWLGLRFYGGNDLVTLSDGSILWVNYNSSQPIEPQTSLGVWLLPPAASPRILVADLPDSPNGITVSPNEDTLYVTVFPTAPDVPASETTGNKIYAFDLVQTGGDIFAENRRIFAGIDYGFADGIKLDVQGNLFASTKDGVQVFNAGGELIGKILIPNTWSEQAVNSLVFAQSKLVLLHHTNVLVLQTNTTGASA